MSITTIVVLQNEMQYGDFPETPPFSSYCIKHEWKSQYLMAYLEKCFDNQCSVEA